MRQKSIVIITASFVIIIILLLCLYNLISPLMIVWSVWKTGPYVDETPKELFIQYVLDDNLPLPSKISVEGLQRTQFFVPLKGPVYIHFKTDDVFVEALVNRKSQFYEPYTEISCGSFFKVTQDYGDAQNHPERFDWWLPANITSPICYRSERKSPVYDDEAKYLLIDIGNSEVYFFRTVTPQMEAD